MVKGCNPVCVALERQLARYRIPVRPLLREMAREEREQA